MKFIRKIKSSTKGTKEPCCSENHVPTNSFEKFALSSTMDITTTDCDGMSTGDDDTITKDLAELEEEMKHEDEMSRAQEHLTTGQESGENKRVSNSIHAKKESKKVPLISLLKTTSDRLRQRYLCGRTGNDGGVGSHRGNSGFSMPMLMKKRDRKTENSIPEVTVEHGEEEPLGNFETEAVQQQPESTSVNLVDINNTSEGNSKDAGKKRNKDGKKKEKSSRKAGQANAGVRFDLDLQAERNSYRKGRHIDEQEGDDEEEDHKSSLSMGSSSLSCSTENSIKKSSSDLNTDSKAVETDVAESDDTLKKMQDFLEKFNFSSGRSVSSSDTASTKSSSTSISDDTIFSDAPCVLPRSNTRKSNKRFSIQSKNTMLSSSASAAMHECTTTIDTEDFYSTILKSASDDDEHIEVYELAHSYDSKASENDDILEQGTKVDVNNKNPVKNKAGTEDEFEVSLEEDENNQGDRPDFEDSQGSSEEDDDDVDDDVTADADDESAFQRIQGGEDTDDEYTESDCDDYSSNPSSHSRRRRVKERTWASTDNYDNDAMESFDSFSVNRIMSYFMGNSSVSAGSTPKRNIVMKHVKSQISQLPSTASSLTNQTSYYGSKDVGPEQAPKEVGEFRTLTEDDGDDEELDELDDDSDVADDDSGMTSFLGSLNSSRRKKHNAFFTTLSQENSSSPTTILANQEPN